MVKVVSFKKKENDLVEHVKDKDFSYYVKDLIRKDMNKTTDKKEVRKINTNFGM
jgi:hypothetical protein